MSIDKQIVQKIARLARLHLPPDRQDAMAGELGAILNWVEMLQALDTSAAPPLASPARHALPLRPDIVTEGDNREAILSNAPMQASGFFIVPKVVE